MGRVIHFEIHAENPDRAIAFYSSLLGWQFAKWDGPMEYWTIATGSKAQPGIDGGLVRRRGTGPGPMDAVNAFVCTSAVENIDDAMSKLVELGGLVALPKMPVPGIGWLGYGKDTEGNIFGMMQNDPTTTM